MKFISVARVKISPNVVLVNVSVMALVITHQSTLTIPIICLLSYRRQSLREHKCYLNTRYKDTPHFQDPLRLEK